MIIRQEGKTISLLVFLLMFGSLSWRIPSVSSSSSVLVARNVIYIEGNSGFTAANGVVGGSGTPEDPYIIEGWNIDGGGGYCILINSTDKHFVIRDVWTHNGSNGIYFFKVKNGIIYNSRSTENEYGIFLFKTNGSRIDKTNSPNNKHAGIILAGSSNNSIIMNIICNNKGAGHGCGVAIWGLDNIVSYNNISSNGETGIELRAVSGNIVKGNKIHNHDGGIRLLEERSFNNMILENDISGNWYGVFLSGGYSNFINFNNITSNEYGICVGFSSPAPYRNTVSGNLVTLNRRGGIKIDWSDNNTISNNTLTRNAVGTLGYWCFDVNGGMNNTISGNLISDNPLGLRLRYPSKNNTIYHNSFIDNGVQASYDGGMEKNAWNYSGDGNYWSDYKGRDNNWDGLGDTPYMIDHKNLDYYPLLYTKVIVNKAYQSSVRCEVGSIQTISFHALWSHNYSDISGGNIFVNGTRYVTNSSGWISFTTTSVTAGAQKWTVTGVLCLHRRRVITDYNQTVPSPSMIWEADTTAPVLSITSPIKDSIVRSSSSNISWSGSDGGSGIDHYEVKIDGGQWVNTEKSTTYTFTGLVDGWYSVSVKAVDKAGLSNEAQVNFTVNTSLIGGPRWIDDAAVFSAAGVCLVLVTFLLVKRRRRW